MEAGHRAIRGPSIDSTWCSLGTRFFVSSILEEVDEAIDERRDAANSSACRPRKTGHSKSSSVLHMVPPRRREMGDRGTSTSPLAGDSQSSSTALSLSLSSPWSENNGVCVPLLAGIVSGVREPS